MGCLPPGIYILSKSEVSWSWRSEEALAGRKFITTFTFIFIQGDLTQNPCTVICFNVCMCMLQFVIAQQDANLFLRTVLGEFEDNESRSKEEIWKHLHSQILS